MSVVFRWPIVSLYMVVCKCRYALMIPADCSTHLFYEMLPFLAMQEGRK